MAFRKVFLPDRQLDVVLVPREQLRFRRHSRCFGLAEHLRHFAGLALPTPPETFSGSQSRKIKYPMLGNDRVGDCYYTDVCHCVQTFTGNATGAPVQFDTAAVVRRYQEVSRGDNGLSDDQIFPEWKRGIVGPDGPHKILDEMTVDPRDVAAIKSGLWYFCGASWTCGLLTGWLNATSSGTIWDAGMGRSDPSAGHAMHLSGWKLFNGRLVFEPETWGIDQILVTHEGILAADSEITLQFSLEMFNAQGIAPHSGLSYDASAALWKQLGGITLPPNPFGPPPPKPPTPPAGSGYVITIPADLPPGAYTVGEKSPPVPPQPLLPPADKAALQSAKAAIDTLYADLGK